MHISKIVFFGFLSYISLIYLSDVSLKMRSDVTQSISREPTFSLKSLGFSFHFECFTKSYVAVSKLLVLYFPVSGI